MTPKTHSQNRANYSLSLRLSQLNTNSKMYFGETVNKADFCLLWFYKSTSQLGNTLPTNIRHIPVSSKSISVCTTVATEPFINFVDLSINYLRMQ